MVPESKLMGVWMELFSPYVATPPSETSTADQPRVELTQSRWPPSVCFLPLSSPGRASQNSRVSGVDFPPSAGTHSLFFFFPTEKIVF